ncbi:MAG: phospholipid carrier-dependent glycosyltransferase, partial [Bacteroidaceae bacterium]
SLIWPYWKLRFKELPIKRTYLFSVLWTLLALVLLSLIPEKKTRYLLPLLIPGALNIAFFLYYFATTRFIPRKEKIFYRINISIILVVLCALPIGLYLLFYKQGDLSLWLYLLISVIGLLLAGVLYYSTFRSKSMPMYPLFCIVSVMMLVEGLCFIPVSRFFINDERCSIRGVRTIKEVQRLPFYYVEGEDMRIELVYESNRIIRPLNVKDQKMILSKLPFVLVSGLAPDSVLHGLPIQTKVVAVYDNNWQKRSNKRYNKSLVRYVSIIRKE